MIVFFLLSFFQPFSSYEFVLQTEDGTPSGSGVSVLTQEAGYLGSGYVGRFENGDDTLSLNVDIAAEYFGTYEVVFRFLTFGGSKTFTLFLDDVAIDSVVLADASSWVNHTIVLVDFTKTSSVLKMQAAWTWFAIDCIYFNLLPPPPPKDYSLVVEDLVDPLATEETKDLYAWLRKVYGKKTLAGHTFECSDDVSTATGKKPILIAYDFGVYSPMFPYAWDGDHTFGPRPDLGQMDDCIDAYHASNGDLVVSWQWHWGSPGGPRDSSAGTNTFYTQYTTFDIREAVKTGTTERNEIERDIDAIAVELKRLQSEKIPVLWRPLHEASGGWFWWGAQGEAPLIALWNILFDRLHNYHEIHNLIWVFNSEEWWPGLDKLDIYSFDSYPAGLYNYQPQRTVFNSMYDKVEGKKIVAMSENGPIPDIPECYKESVDAKWLYFMTWDQQYLTHNENDHLQMIYHHDLVLTLDERHINLDDISDDDDDTSYDDDDSTTTDDDSTTDDDDDNDDDKSNVGKIVGGVIGGLSGGFVLLLCVVGIIVAIVIILVVVVKKKKGAMDTEMTEV